MRTYGFLNSNCVFIGKNEDKYSFKTSVNDRIKCITEDLLLACTKYTEVFA